MYTARIVVLIIALVAGGLAAYLVRGSDSTPPPTAPVAQLPTVDVLVAKADIGLGQTVTPENLLWQTWPAATASNSFIRRSERPEATNEVAGSIARAPFIAGEPIREPKLVKANGSGFMAAILPTGMRAISTEISPETGAGGFILPNDRVDVILSKREKNPDRNASGDVVNSEIILTQYSCSRDRPGAEGKRRPERRGRQDRDARIETRAGGNARTLAPDRHAGAGAAQHRRRQRDCRQRRAGGQKRRQHQRGSLRRRKPDDDTEVKKTTQK